jgi:predicted phage-related endonuclease
MTITYHPCIQGDADWLKLHCGIITSSVMGRILTPKEANLAKNKEATTMLLEKLAEKITQSVPEGYQSYDMMRGHADEVEARMYYEMHYEPVQQLGLITNDEWGFTLGYSPDGIVGEDGLIEIKSRAPKYQVQTILEDAMPEEYAMQLQLGLLVSGRKWCDFVSYCGGFPMYVKRIYPDVALQGAIIDAARQFYDRMDELYVAFAKRLENPSFKVFMTERREYSFNQPEIT